MSNLKREDLIKRIWRKDKSLQLKDIRHILVLREEAIIEMLEEGNTFKDGKLVQFDYVDKPERVHYNGFAEGGGAKVVLPPSRIYQVKLSKVLKRKINHTL